MTNTITKKQALEIAFHAVLNCRPDYSIVGEDVVFSAEEVAAKLEMMIAQLDARATAPKTPSKTQQENVTHKLHLLSALSAADAPMNIPDLCAAVEGGLTPNKVSALMGQLVKEEKAIRIQGKGKDRKVTFMLA